MTAVADDMAADAEAQPFRGTLRPDHVASGADFAESDADSTSTAAAQGNGTAASADIPAQEPVAIADAPSLVPPIDPPALPDVATAGNTDEIEHFAARRRRLQVKRKKARRSSRWTALILVLFAFNVALIGARSEVVRFLPQTASLFSAIGLPVNLRI